MKNFEISRIFRDIAGILEIKGENVFRIRAYERAAQNIEGLTESIEEYVSADRLREIPGIGQDLSDKIKEYVNTGKIKAYEDLKKTIPAGLLDLLTIPGVGPKTAKLLYEKLKIKSILDLEEAIKNKKLEGLPGVKEKTIENISKGIAIVKKGKERMSLAEAMQVADEFITALGKLPIVTRISSAGSLRRQKETVRDIDILVISARPEALMDAFVKLSPVKEILSKGRTKSSVRTEEGVQVDCRVVEDKSFGAALLYFTGSKNFNIKIRQLAIKSGLKVNEYGVFRDATFVAGGTEQDVFKILTLPYIEPELREDNGEIELAQENKLPVLIEAKDIKGDLHVHSDWSDGGNTIEEMARAAKKKGYSYAAITDHSQGLKVAGGLSVGDLKKKRAQIDKINKKLVGFRVLFGTEVDIDSSGALDYPDTVLKEFDVVVAAIHSGFKQSKQQITKRLIKACENKYVHIIAHPTGRLWGVREPYEVDFNELFKTARQTHTYMEINSFPQRLDLNDLNSRYAKEMGVKLAINTDSHTTEQLDSIKLGIAVGRRGWLTKEDVINTLSAERLLKALRK
jgi:DNA polymerase (family 10)